MEIQDKHLLITLGDSWTYGVGCSDILPNHCGWHSFVKEKMNFSEVLNLALPGGSNSATVKEFVNTVIHKDFCKNFKKITVVFLLTGYERFSFYSKGQISSFTVHGMHETNDKLYDKFLEWYVTQIQDGDAERETIFYLDIVESVCKLYGYNFFWGTAFSDVNNLIAITKTNQYKHIKLDTTKCLHHAEFKSFRDYLVSESKNSPYNIVGEFEYGTHHEYFAPCGHPNEKGYELIANYIVNKLRR